MRGGQLAECEWLGGKVKGRGLPAGTCLNPGQPQREGSPLCQLALTEQLDVVLWAPQEVQGGEKWGKVGGK